MTGDAACCEEHEKKKLRVDDHEMVRGWSIQSFKKKIRNPIQDIHLVTLPQGGCCVAQSLGVETVAAVWCF